YFNLIDLAKKHGLDIFGSDLPSGIKTRISRGGLESLNSLERSQLKHSGFEDLAYQEMMYQEFRDGHCGWGEASLLRRLYQTWIARNDRMAASIVTMTDERPKGPVVVILGNGHVRHDMGVYERVGHLRPALKQLNLGFREITVEPTPLADYLSTETVAGKTFAPIHQLLWFTQRQDYEDPCALFFAPKK
ncbi:MAG: ChaN family lipoprotein, partial [Motiliproteus sp.]|nr:ChaN family lipoprotein [Motiliproteus sp.]